MEGRITADSAGNPYVVLPVTVYLDLFDQLRQGLVGIVQLHPNGMGGWALDIACHAEEAEVGFEEEHDGGE